MKKTLKYLEFLNENLVEEYNNTVKEVSDKFPLIMKLNSYVKYGNFGGLKKPITDNELVENENLLKLAVQKFDELFKTSYYNTYGLDYSTLLKNPNIHKIYYGDVIKQLIMNSFNINVYHNIFKYESVTIEDFVYKFIIFKMVQKDVSGLETEFKKSILNKLPKAINKKMFLYRFFKNFGNQFNTDIVENILGISKKNMYEMGGVNIKADKIMQKIFLSILKKELDKYKDIISVDTVLDNLLNGILSYYDNNTEDNLKDVIHDKYVAVKLKEYFDFLEEIKK